MSFLKPKREDRRTFHDEFYDSHKMLHQEDRGFRLNKTEIIAIILTIAFMGLVICGVAASLVARDYINTTARQNITPNAAAVPSESVIVITAFPTVNSNPLDFSEDKEGYYEYMEMTTDKFTEVGRCFNTAAEMYFTDSYTAARLVKDCDKDFDIFFNDISQIVPYDDHKISFSVYMDAMNYCDTGYDYMVQNLEYEDSFSSDRTIENLTLCLNGLNNYADVLEDEMR
jgi:hypothetical protein